MHTPKLVSVLRHFTLSLQRNRTGSESQSGLWPLRITTRSIQSGLQKWSPSDHQKSVVSCQISVGLFFIYGVRLRLWTAAVNGHIVHPQDDIRLKSDGGMILTGENRRTRRKICPSATLSTTNPTRVDPGANLGLRGERSATNRLSHSTALDGVSNFWMRLSSMPQREC
jgi:hypothetical protein